MTNRITERFEFVPTLDAVKQAARERARSMNLRYAGALQPNEAFTLMQAGARLIDVRTCAEREWVGHVPGAWMIEWETYPGNQRNPNFLAQLTEAAEKDALIMFMCRSGARSHRAAATATAAGWRECYNVLEGFEGDKDTHQHRSTIGGWRAAGLPWVQN